MTFDTNSPAFKAAWNAYCRAINKAIEIRLAAALEAWEAARPVPEPGDRNAMAPFKRQMMDEIEALGFDAGMFDNSEVAACFYRAIEAYEAARPKDGQGVWVRDNDTHVVIEGCTFGTAPPETQG